MIFLVGPRQVGKTTLAKSFLVDQINGTNYFNWDVASHRKVLSTQIFLDKIDLNTPERKILVFDEIHKYRRWKNALKGLFDTYEPNTHWIVTGSAALDVYRKGQDSLVGRAFSYHLCPLSVAELTVGASRVDVSPKNLVECNFTKQSDDAQNVLEALLKFGGFPEPFLEKSESFLNKWRSTRLDKLINQDLASTETLKNLPLVEQLMFLLPERVGNPLSLNSLREDLEIHFATVKHWLELLERVFYGFIIKPYSKKLAKAIKKEGKWYLWDWSEISDEGARFENMIAVHLIKYVHYINDFGINNLSLFFIRDKEKREVDFLLCSKNECLILLECKTADTTPSKSLAYFSKLLRPKRTIQLVRNNIQPFTVGFGDVKVDILPAASFLQALV